MRALLGVVLLAASGRAGWFSRSSPEKPDTKHAPLKADAPEAPSADDHTCAAGLAFDVYKNGASEDPVRVDMSGGQCETVAAFEAAVSRAVCADTASCHVRDGTGRRVRRCSELSFNAAQAGVQPAGLPRAYGVRRDMRWVFPTEEVGFQRYLPHLQIILTTLAESPRLFALENFLTEQDASQLIEDALAITDAEHKLTRSSVGAKGYTVSTTRTSENAWVKDTKTAVRMWGPAPEPSSRDMAATASKRAGVVAKDRSRHDRGTTRKQRPPGLRCATRPATMRPRAKASGSWLITSEHTTTSYAPAGSRSKKSRRSMRSRLLRMSIARTARPRASRSCVLTAPTSSSARTTASWPF